MRNFIVQVKNVLSSYTFCLTSCFSLQIVTEATVSEITQLSPSVKGLRLKVEDRGFAFKPGQW